MKTIEELSKKTTKKSITRSNGKTLFSEMSQQLQTEKKSIFEIIFDEYERFTFVKPIIVDNVVIFFQQELSKNIIDSIISDGTTYDELSKIEKLEEYGIVNFSRHEKILHLLNQNDNSHCSKFWITNNLFHIYCQVGSKYCYISIKIDENEKISRS